MPTQRGMGSIPEYLREMNDEQLQVYRDVLAITASRMSLIARQGLQYSGERNIYEALGYKTILSFEDYYAKYDRQDIAAAIIDRPIEATWRDNFNLLESTDDEDTPLEKAWDNLAKEFDLKAKFERVDTLASIGQYAILLLGLNDIDTPEGNASPVTGKNLKLVYVKPISEGNAKIDKWDTESTSPRFGLPELYSVTVSIGETGGNKILKVHHSRVIHIVGKTLESESLGIPVLKNVYNRLDDLEKLVGSSAEMFWRGARPGYSAKTDEGFSMSSTDRDDLLTQISEYEHNLRRILVSQGVSIEALASQVADPAPHVDIQIQMISAVKGIPKRILTGTERGELASSTDRDTWMDLIDARRQKNATEQIIRPFVNRSIEYGILPPVKSEEDGYEVEWPDSYALTEKDRTEIGRTRATALKEYASNATAEDMVPLEAFLKIIWGLDDKEIELITEQREAQLEDALKQEEKELLEAQEELERQKALENQEVNKEEPNIENEKGV